MKKVALVTTGGTIASHANSEGKLVSGAISGDELTKLLELPNDIEVIVSEIFKIPSPHITLNQLWELKAFIESLFKDEKIAGVVITHGTDTLEETAYFLDLTISDNRPVVITGSQLSPFETGTDANRNLKQAIIVAASDLMRETGTVVVFNERIFSARYVKKVHTSNVAGFSTNSFGYLGDIDGQQISIYQKLIKRETYNITDKIPNVDIIPCYIGADGKFIQAAIDNNVAGFILEGFGRGQVPLEMVGAIEQALDKKIEIILTSRSHEGKVAPTYDYEGSAADLMRKGVILGKDYDSKKARIKLCVLLSANSDVKKGFNK